MNSSPKQPAPIASWVYVIVILGTLLIATGAILAIVHPAMLVSPRDTIGGAAKVYAGYFASRNLAIAIFLLVLLYLRARQALANLMVLVALIQLLDAGMDCVEGRWMIAPGVLVLGLAFSIGAMRLTGYPFWRLQAWGR